MARRAARRAAADGASLWSFDAEGGLQALARADDLGNLAAWTRTVRAARTPPPGRKFRCSALVGFEPAT